MSVKEMYMVPKETYLKLMDGMSKSQKSRVDEINVEQLNVSCGPLFAGVKTGEIKKKSPNKRKLKKDAKEPEFETKKQIAPSPYASNNIPWYAPGSQQKVIAGKSPNNPPPQPSQTIVQPQPSSQAQTQTRKQAKAKKIRKRQILPSNVSFSPNKDVLNEPEFSSEYARKLTQTLKPRRTRVFENSNRAAKRKADFDQSSDRGPTPTKSNPEIEIHSDEEDEGDFEDGLKNREQLNSTRASVFDKSTELIPVQSAESQVQSRVLSNSNLNSSIGRVFNKDVSETPAGAEALEIVNDRILREGLRRAERNEQEVKEMKKNLKKRTPSSVATLRSNFENNSLLTPQFASKQMVTRTERVAMDKKERDRRRERGEYIVSPKRPQKKRYKY